MTTVKGVDTYGTVWMPTFDYVRHIAPHSATRRHQDLVGIASMLNQSAMVWPSARRTIRKSPAGNKKGGKKEKKEQPQSVL